MSTDTNERSGYSGFAVLEIMGHRVVAGYVEEWTIAGAGVLRVAIPDGDRTVVQFYPPSSLFAMTPVGEEEARLMAKRHPIEPVDEWTIRPATRERIETEERTRIEGNVRRLVEREQRETAAEERRRVLEILSSAKAVARTAAGALPDGTVEIAEANQLVEAIDAYCGQGRRPYPAEPRASTYVDSEYDDGDDDEESWP